MSTYSQYKRYEVMMNRCFSEERAIVALILAFVIGIRIGVLYITSGSVMLNPAVEPTTMTYLSAYVLICVAFSGLCYVPYLIFEGIRKLYYTYRYRRAKKDFLDFPWKTYGAERI